MDGRGECTGFLVLLSARNRLLDPHAPGGLDVLPDREAADPLCLLPLLRREVFAELPVGLCIVHLVLLLPRNASDTTLDRELMQSLGRYKMPRIGKTETLNLRIDPELKHAAGRAAASDRRSVTAYVEKLIEDDCRARGFLTETGSAARPAKRPRGK